MTVLTMTAQPVRDTSLRPVPWRRMAWVTWRQHRVGLAGVAVLFGGLGRSERPRRGPLAHGDVVVWGGPARLRYHGVMPLREGRHPLLGASRVNLSLRKAG